MTTFSKIAAALVLILVTGPWSPVPAFIGMRPIAGENIGTLRDSDAIGIDRIDEVGQKKTTPLDLYGYMLGKLNNVVAPAAHGHADASTSAAGFLTAIDKYKLDFLPPTTRGNAASVSGSWVSLATAGYYVATAQSRWPYLTANGLVGGVHLIQTADDLAAYSVDWCSMQNTVNQGAGSLAIISNGTHIIERTVEVPSQTVVAGLSKASFILPHTTWTGAKNLLTVPANSYEVTITGLKLQENPWPAINAGQFTGVFVGAASYRIRIERNAAVRLAKLVFFDKSSDQATVVDNDTDDVTQEVWYSKGTTADWHSNWLVDNNDFLHSYKEGDSYAVRAEDGTQFTYFRITNNRVLYQSLFRLYNVTTTVDGPSMFSEISRNRVIGIPNGLPIIYWIGKTTYTAKMADNFFWGGPNIIEIGGQVGLSITGLTGPDSSSHTRCVVKLLAPVKNMLIGGLATIDIGSIPTVCADYSLAGVGNMSSATTYSHINLAGSAISLGSELDVSKLSTEYLKFTGAINKQSTIYFSRILAPDEGSIAAFGDNLTVTLRKSMHMPAGHRIYLFNFSSTNLIIAGNGEVITRLDGNYGPTMTVAPYVGVELLVAYTGMGNQWRQIR